MSFGENLRILRTKAGIRQEELGRELGVSGRTILKYENEQNYPSAELLPKISKFFNVSIDELMNETEEFIALAYEMGGSKGAREAKDLVDGVVGLFAGGGLSDDDRDAAMKAIQEAYWIAKEESKKFTPQKYLGKHAAE